MLSNAYLLAKFRFDTAENERNFAENLPKIGNYPTDHERLLLRGPRPQLPAHARSRRPQPGRRGQRSAARKNGKY